MRKLVQLIRASLICAIVAAAAPAAADQPTIINNPAEKYNIAPGGVDMRTGQYVYSETDLSIGPNDGGLALTRTTPVYVSGHANPFGNFSHNWDIMIVERRIGLAPPMESGPDFRMNVHIGGRSFVFEGPETTSAYSFKSDGPDSSLTISSGSKSSTSVVNTVRGPDGTQYEFRPMGSQDCTISRRCAFIAKMTQPDGTLFTFDYEYNAGAAGNRARLTRVTSSRGYVLILEGSGSKITKACVINSALVTPPAGATCPAGALATATYGYEVGGRLSSATVNNAVSQFTYAPAGSLTAMSFIKPGYTTPWLTNKYFLKNDEEEVPHEIVQEQNFADGRTFTYNYDQSPYTVNKPYTTIAGGNVTDAHGHQIVVQYEWPIMPGSRERTCSTLPCGPPMPEDEYKYTYQQTTGPALIVDENGRETRIDYCEPSTWVARPALDPDKCAINKNYNVILPELGTGYIAGSRLDVANSRVEHDALGNVVKITKFPKAGSSLPPIITEAAFAYGPFTQMKPSWRRDANGNQTDWTYDPAHGGVLTETGPAVSVNGVSVRPQKRFTYVQRYAWLKSGGGYAQAATPIWLLASESFCRTSAGSTSGCAGGAADEVVTSYDYGPNSGPNNLLLRGTVVTADAQSRRTCFGYDAFGRKISETTPNANLTSCP